MANHRPPLHRRRLLIDKSIQIPLLTYSVCMTSIGLVVASAFSVLWANVMESEFSWLGPFVLVGGGVLSFAIMIFLGLFVTNRVAGPLFRLRQHMQAVADGENPDPIVSREDDFTSELFREYNRLLARMGKKR